jgi:predicted MFS family arabinose efflux permease
VTATRSEPLTLALVTAVVFGFATAVTMLGPVLLAVGQEFRVPVGTVGLLAAATAVPWALGAPLAGAVSDRLGRRPLVVLALLGVGGASALSALAPSFPFLLATRLLAGVAGAFGPPVLLAAVGDLFPSARRARAMGWFNMGFAMAAIVGVPAVGFLGGWLGWRAAFAGLGAVLIALAVVVRLGFPHLPPARGRAPEPARGSILRAPDLLPLLAANQLERMLMFMVTLYLPAFLMLAYGLDMAQVAPPLSLIALGAVAGNLVGGWLADRMARPVVFGVAELLAGLIALGLFAWRPGLWPSVLVGIAFGLANALGRPAMLAQGSDLVPERRGAVLGLVSLTNQGGMVAGSALGGLAVDLGGHGALGLAAGAAGALAAGLAACLSRRRGPCPPG